MSKPATAPLSRPLMPLDKTPLSIQVVRAIRSAVLAGRYPPGQRLREEEMASELSVSRHAVRVALSSLEAQGLLVGDPYRGRSVAAFSAQQLDYLLPARVLLETEALKRAIGRLTADSERQMRR